MNIVKSITKRMRKNKAKKFIKDEENKRLLDIGCGDRSFINSFKKLQVIGIDKKLGYDVEKGLKFKDESFDYVTLLAVIEHISEPRKLLSECRRVLKKNGLLIITTPIKQAEKFIKLYHWGEIDHKNYFNKGDFTSLNGFKLIEYSTFEFGLNQLIILKK